MSLLEHRSVRLEGWSSLDASFLKCLWSRVVRTDGFLGDNKVMAAFLLTPLIFAQVLLMVFVERMTAEPAAVVDKEKKGS